jgi:carboxyl-terminal processing protease
MQLKTYHSIVNKKFIMASRKKIQAVFLLLFCLVFAGLRPAYGDHPDHYPEKRSFYDSLSLVMNKYIVPVENWTLFEGTIQGVQSLFEAGDFKIKSENDQIELVIGDSPPINFTKEKIDYNAIELVESLSKIFDTIFNQFPDRNKIHVINSALKGMVATLEPNSYFIEPGALKRLQAQNRGVYEGVGLEITTKDEIVTIVSPYEGTPAFRLGLLPNDRILAVDGKPTRGLRIMDVSEKIRGGKGKPVTLTIERQGWDSPRDFVLIKDTISHRTLKFFELEPGLGYIRIINFLGTTYDDFAAALQELSKLSPLEGLVLDLRYTPGGLLNQSLAIADSFLFSGTIARTEGRIKSGNKTYYAQPKTLSAGYPIVVLVNEGSASGSEIVAAALRANQRAIIVGERTFGKGLIQTVFPVQTGGAIRLTTSMLLTPDGNKIQGIGISPDLTINPTLLDYEKSEKKNPAFLKKLELGATKDDPSVQLCLDILRLSLLLRDTPEEELEGLSDEQATLKKDFNGLNKAVEEISPRMKKPTF